MKKLLLALGIAAVLCSPAMAGLNANGAMVVHTDNSVIFSAGWDYCANVTIPTLCGDLNPTSTKVVDDAAAVWIVAAWLETATPSVTAFQYGIYHNMPDGYIDSWSPCGPGWLEIPATGWPANGTGTAVAFSGPVDPRYTMKMYWFGVYNPGPGAYFGPGDYVYGADPYAAFADSQNPPQLDRCNYFGTLRWAPDAGSNTCPPEVPTDGACCLPTGACIILNEGDCTAQGGTFQGVGIPCEQVTCPQPGACCHGDVCTMELQTDCESTGGVFHGGDCTAETCVIVPQPQACCFGDGHCENLVADACQTAGGTPEGEGTTCETFTCPQPGACCINEVCSMRLESDCLAAGGTFFAGEDCSTFTCPPVATQPSTWGHIKAGYR